MILIKYIIMKNKDPTPLIQGFAGHFIIIQKKERKNNGLFK